jgi:hypothetical protein
MSEDIVTKLRKFAPQSIKIGDDLHADNLLEACNEIERLRLERDDYKEMYRLAKECLDFIYARKKWWRK